MSLANLKQLAHVYARNVRHLALDGNYAHLDQRQHQHHYQQVAATGAGEKKPKDDEKEPLFYLDRELIGESLATYSPCMVSISLDHLDLSTMSFGLLLDSFVHLAELRLNWCHLGDVWFAPQQFKQHQVPHATMRLLRLARTSGRSLDVEDVRAIATRVPNLHTLSLSQSQSSIDDACVALIVGAFERLRELDLVNTQISDEAIIRHVCESTRMCAQLTRLNVCMSSQLSNRSLEAICRHLRQLKCLYLTSCFGISNVDLVCLLTRLSYLNINNTSIDRAIIKNVLVPQLPNCEIEHGHEKMLTAKSMWTINGSRNSVCSF